MLTRNQFLLLNTMRQHDDISTQREISDLCGLSAGTVNALLNDALARHWVSSTGRSYHITSQGHDQMAPYKVDNAIIMAAGMSTRFAPLSYERPKGMLRVHGEVLIERQIYQLQAAGITDITVVVGYMGEEFYYLAQKLGVDIVENEAYATRNNNSTLHRIADRLGNTYICSSDDYFTQNVFEPYVFEAYYSGVYVEGPTDEYCIHTTSHRLIDRVTIGGSDSWIMLGHAYFDRRFSKRFVEILESIYDRPETRDKLWEDIYIEHLHELPMVLRTYDTSVIHEFDSLEELRAFDADFIANVDSTILDNICRTLACGREDISNVTPIRKSVTNLSFEFEVGGAHYVYRHPRTGSDTVVNRKSEIHSEKVALELDLDDTFIYEDPDTGWKISRFVEESTPFDYHNSSQVSEALALARRLHGSNSTSDWVFDVHERAESLKKVLIDGGRIPFPGFEANEMLMGELDAFVKADGVAPCLCHNNLYPASFLVGHDRMRLIDWKYSGLSDYASDLGTFISCSDYTYEEALSVLDVYFGRPSTPSEQRHCVAYVALTSWFWFLWSIHQDMIGKQASGSAYHWYQHALEYGDKALELYSTPLS